MENQYLQEIYQDIFCHHQLESNFINKIIIIHGDIPIDSMDRDGIIDVISSKKDWYEHHHYWHKYLEMNYLENLNIQRFAKNKKDKTHFEILKDCLNCYHDIIFYDTTDLDDFPSYDNSMLFIPRVISKKQYQALEEIASYLNQYREIWIMGGNDIDDCYRTENFNLNDILKTNDSIYI